MVSSLAKKTRDASVMGSSKAYTYRRSRGDKCSNSASQAEGRVFTIKPICYGGG